MEKKEKNFFYVVVYHYHDDKSINGYFAFADAVKVNGMENLFAYLKDLEWEDRKIVSVNAVATKKEAEKTARQWNECYMENGTYAFGK